MAQKLLIIDTDCGIDDALAIIVALAAPGVKVLGITCCFGNTDVDNVCQNVMRVLTVCQQTQVSLIALGPLTNLALAVRLDPTLPQKLKDLYIMGGNMEGKGNLTPSAEFNFSMDAESAYVVLEEYTCSTHIATWEFTCRNKLSWECFDELVNQDTSAARFMKKITSTCWAYSREPRIINKDLLFGRGFVPYDAFAVAACLDRSVITETLQCAVRVEMHGQLGRGMMVVDAANTLKKDHRVFVMRTCDLKKFGLMLKAALQIA
ncbi:uncharacterized protein LOC127959785 isoform X2 [Carassius gibelio]|uniref:uncharacterized protein LOC127959785 isoform X2 n=1 Tax=Carassius gibelio TaxID=101364 RepID=UPI00227986F1|nr:uncharacterized protein LOC127959785 isoform X2 [Carassius gibelio]